VEFERRGDLVYARTDWPEELTVDREFLIAADPQCVVRHGARIHFTVANGHATYSVVQDDTRLPTLELCRVASVYEPA
jgi:hypothetical protein